MKWFQRRNPGLTEEQAKQALVQGITTRVLEDVNRDTYDLLVDRRYRGRLDDGTWYDVTILAVQLNTKLHLDMKISDVPGQVANGERP